MKTPFSGLLPGEIQSSASLDRPFRAMQIFRALHSGSADFSSMTTLPAPLRKSLESEFTLYGSEILQVLKDEDGNGKLSLRLEDGRVIECVLLCDSSGRKTACLSTQAGCAMGCLFCKTGEGGFFRNLTAGEIVEQFLHLEKVFGKISNIVFMGMGEPLENTDNLFRACEILCHPEGKGLSSRRITVSTCGLADRIEKLASEGPPFRLAVSLNSAVQEKREKIMPVAKAFPLPVLKKALLAYQNSRKKRITLEYVLIKGFNTAHEDAKALLSFISGLSVILNVIPWNPAPGLSFETPAAAETEKFCSFLDSMGITYARRRKKAGKIRGACGQLASSGQLASPDQLETQEQPLPGNEGSPEIEIAGFYPAIDPYGDSDT